MIDISAISTKLKLGDDKIWHTPDSLHISYPSDGNENYFAIEDNSFWFKHRNNCITSIVRSYPPESNETIFDIGGGNGVVSIGLVNAGFDVVLVEPGKDGASNAKKRGLSNIICATIESADFNTHSLPAVGLFDVIEHVEDDLSFLKSIRKLIKKGGMLYATVPTYPALWSADDILAGHYRRYSIEGISNLLKSSGFEIEYSSYFFRFLPFPMFLLRALPYKVGLTKIESSSKTINRDHATKTEFTTKLLDYVLDLEIKNINRKCPMRFGSSCIIVARNPQQEIE